METLLEGTRTRGDAAADGDDRRTAAFFRALRPYARVADTLKKMPASQLRSMFTAVAPPVSPGQDAGRSAGERTFLYHGPAELKSDLTGVLRAVAVRHCGDDSIRLNVVDAPTMEAAAAMALNAGCDMNCGDVGSRPASSTWFATAQTSRPSISMRPGAV